jgi:hypothetical protein
LDRTRKTMFVFSQQTRAERAPPAKGDTQREGIIVKIHSPGALLAILLKQLVKTSYK